MKQTQQTQQYRQGDVYIVSIEQIPADVSVRRNGILAEGEVTGHSHALVDLKAADLLVGSQGELYLQVTSPDGAMIRHEEHGPIRIPRGAYEVRIQREYSPEEIRNVAD